MPQRGLGCCKVGVGYGAAVPRHDLDCASDVGVEGVEVFGRDPVLQDIAAADLMQFVGVEKGAIDIELGDEANAAVRDVPLPGDLGGIPAMEHRVEDRLLGQPRWPGPPAQLLDEVELVLAGGSPQGHHVAVVRHGWLPWVASAHPVGPRGHRAGA